jgi:chromosome segregation ATPase
MDNPLQGTEPPIQELAPWWPIIVFLISVAMTAISSAWAAYLSYNEWKRKRAEKLIDAEKEHALQSEQRKQAVEIEELKLTFAARQQVMDSLRQQLEILSAQHQLQLDEGRKMREELAKAREELRERDTTIAELRATIAEMQMRIKQLEKEVHTLEQRDSK